MYITICFLFLVYYSLNKIEKKGKIKKLNKPLIIKGKIDSIPIKKMERLGFNKFKVGDEIYYIY